MTKNQLSIRLHGEPVGVLEQTSTGQKTFTYTGNAVMPISISMPIREEPYGELACEAYFGGLLPESAAARSLIGKRYGVSPNNTFALLKAIGYDCAGAISCHGIDEPIIPQSCVPLTGKIMADDELYEHIKALPKKPLFMDVEGLRLSLAGVQDKAAICMIDNQIALPEQGCPTTHILKPASPHFEGMVENEYFILKLAKSIGLPVPVIEIKKIKEITFLLVERYDRSIQNNYIYRVHQEDFCQALGMLSTRKYQNEGGPGLKDCFELLKNTTQPAVDRNLLASAVVFNYLVGNMDAHAKNFSILHHQTAQLAPFYDILCTRVYAELTSKMAMKIGSQYDADLVLPRHWKQLCEEVHYGYRAMMGLIEVSGKKIKQAMAWEEEQLKSKGMHHFILDEIMQAMTHNIDAALKKISGAQH